MDKVLSPREAFKKSYRAARWLRKKRDFDRAYWLADAASDRLIRNEGYDYGPVLNVFNAVLWAMHWRFFKPELSPPSGLSERHYGFSAGPDHFESWFERPKLP
jgi:hypothetical protein